VAKSKQGDPYRYGAAGPNAFDCSGLTYYSFKRVGRTLPRTAQAQYQHAHHIRWQSRTPGVLVFIGTSPSHISHVGIYAGYWSGASRMVNANSASYRGYKVVTAPISEYLGGGRHAYYAYVN
jgi:cell wall-associated NlpC family hydrolase